MDQENEHRRYAEGMCLYRGGELSSCKVRNGVTQATARTKGSSEKINWTQADQMISTGIHNDHCSKPNNPYENLPERNRVFSPGSRPGNTGWH